jgi:hypothetical protein
MIEVRKRQFGAFLGHSIPSVEVGKKTTSDMNERLFGLRYEGGEVEKFSNTAGPPKLRIDLVLILLVGISTECARAQHSNQ